MLNITNQYIFNTLLALDNVDSSSCEDVYQYYPDKNLDDLNYYSYNSVASKIIGEKIGFIPKGFLAKRYCQRKLVPKDEFTYSDADMENVVDNYEYYDISQMGYKFNPVGMMSSDNNQLILVCRRSISFHNIFSIGVTFLILLYLYFFK